MNTPARPLTEHEIAVLRVVSETLPRTGRMIAIAVESTIKRAQTYVALTMLAHRGLVVVRDATFPAKWLRTPAGTDELAMTRQGVAIC